MKQQQGYVDVRINPELKPWDGMNSFPDPGDYVAVIKEFSPKTSKGGNPMYEATFEIVSGEGGSATPFKGKTIKAWYVISTEAGKRRLLNLLNATNVKVDKRGGFMDVQLLNKMLCLTIIQDSYTQLNDDGQEVTRTSGKVTRERVYTKTANTQTFEDDEDVEETEAAGEDEDSDSESEETSDDDDTDEEYESLEASDDDDDEEAAPPPPPKKAAKPAPAPAKKPTAPVKNGKGKK